MNAIFHTARWVMVSPHVWVPRGVVEVVDGRIRAVHQGRHRGRAIDHGPGIIMPALVNAHTHLSVSACEGSIDTAQGFTEWVRQLIEVRSRVHAEAISTAAFGAAQRAKQRGTGCIGEVGPLEPGASAMRRAGLCGTIFNEFLGNRFEAMDLPFEERETSYSYAGHALHTTAPDVLVQLKHAALERQAVFSLHLAESEAETVFLATGRGEWAMLLESRGIDFSAWDLKRERPVPRAQRLGLLDAGTLAVHLLDVTEAEVEVLARSRTAVCVCPRSNAALHGRLPDLEGFLAAGLTVALGTDSLASAPSLDLFEEMAFMTDHYPGLRPEDILALGTVNGAQALAKQDQGRIEPGHRARLIYVGLEAESARSAASQLVSTPCEQVEWI